MRFQLLWPVLATLLLPLLIQAIYRLVLASSLRSLLQRPPVLTFGILLPLPSVLSGSAA